MGRNVFAGQMNNSVDTRKLGRVDRPLVRIPANFIRPLARSTPHDRANEMAIGFERVDECAANKATGTGDGNDHGC